VHWVASAWLASASPALHGGACGCVPSDTHPASLACSAAVHRGAAELAASNHENVLSCLAFADDGYGSNATRCPDASATRPGSYSLMEPACSTMAPRDPFAIVHWAGSSQTDAWPGWVDLYHSPGRGAEGCDESYPPSTRLPPYPAPVVACALPNPGTAAAPAALVLPAQLASWLDCSADAGSAPQHRPHPHLGNASATDSPLGALSQTHGINSRTAWTQDSPRRQTSPSPRALPSSSSPSLATPPALTSLAQECKGCPVTFCKGCHATEQSRA